MMVLAVSSIVSTSLTGGVVFAIMVLAVRSIGQSCKSVEINGGTRDSADDHI